MPLIPMVKWLLAWRYFLKRPISYLAVAAVSMCVFIVIVVMTVMSGLVREFKAKNHAFVGDCVIETDSLVGFGYYEEFLSRLQEQSFVEAVSPVAKGIGMAVIPQITGEQNIGIEINGIDPAAHSRTTNFASILHYTKNNVERVFSPSYDPELAGCVVGVDVIPYRRQADGSYYYWQQPVPVQIVVSSFPLNLKGGLLRSLDLVSTKTFYYSDDVHSGLVRVDGNAVFIPLEQAQVLFGMDTPFARISAIHIRFKEGTPVPIGTARVRALWQAHVQSCKGRPGADLLDGVRVQTWQENRRSIIAPMEKEETMMTMLFLMLGVITVFIIFVVLYMIVAHKSKDIGILKSIGLNMADILMIFLVFSVFIGSIGSLVGSVGGAVFLYNINDIEDWLYAHYHWQLWNREVYAIGDIPNQLQPELILSVFGAAIAACVVGALVPGVRAARMKPVQSLQVNQL
ncbi:MAG: FtsX-like permease family protein [Planctomycetaceae bacterium]|nr:FtsX-like permease family protein [Planctomycetaceae bacterium]